MDRSIIIVTGAAGFLGSVVVVDLARDHQVIAIDRRRPTDDLLGAAEGVIWHEMDLSDQRAVAALFRTTAEKYGRVDFVIHFAAFYSFGTRRWREYDGTNIRGTANLLRCATEMRVKRFVFASSIAAMLPPVVGGILTEATPTADYIPYAESKSVGEKMLREASDRLPVIMLRIGGVFSDWCELPPLSSLIRMWTSRFPMNRILAGSGAAGFPYIHRADLVALVRCCLDKNERLGASEVLLACQDGAVLHKDLWAVVSNAWKGTPIRPLYVPPIAASIGVAVRYMLGCLIGKAPYERPWMMKYIDRPWIVDTTYTRERLGWDCTAGMGILDRIPAILENLRQHRRRWIIRNKPQNRRQYTYRCAEL
ncbi:MAG: NAD(P)-dependent oxidoreductase [Phycisphaerales bacterium]|nr:MAG: NAD(P)-dependent oxidoreductase [Phycisphaerales bacterium]